MKILFVVNNYYAQGNGLSASARRTVRHLQAAGQDVRVLSGRNADPQGPQPDYPLREFRIPFFDGLVRAHGYRFAKSEKAVIEEAVRWADVVHLEEPFVIQWRTVHIARRLDVPCTATYHLHPENIFFSIGLGNWKFINHTLLRWWRDYVFNACTDIQCPTENVRERLRRFRFKPRLHTISNGIIPEPCIRKPSPDDSAPSHPFLVACIGRLAWEKDQFTLLEALRHSRHAHDIQLYLAGQGPEREAVLAKAMALYEDGIVAYKPICRFLQQAELRELSARADLYIHCAVIEVEGLSALEALQQGVVPVIATGPLTATAQFALDDRSRFPMRDAHALAARIDWWYEHPHELEQMHAAYVASTERYAIDKSIAALVEMFAGAMAS
ncbi:MAG: glycosyltransferase [Bacteroidales bacterium]|nr:glycosyltransferase [Bacteroidales bacterium]